MVPLYDHLVAAGDGSGQITRLLADWGHGDQAALEQLTTLVYSELRRLANGYLRGERSGHTLQPTALVNEAYVRLISQDQQTVRSRAHFFGIAANLMRQVLVDHARKRTAEKRGSDGVRVDLNDIQLASQDRPRDIIALDDALRELQSVDPRKAQVIDLRYFCGMTVEEVAEALQISTATVERETRVARLWLCRHMDGGVAP